MLGLKLTTMDVIRAVEAQNAQVAAGRIGAEPSPASQQISASVLVKGQLSTPDEFGAIVLRANLDGSSVRLRDVADIEVGGESYNFSSRLNGQRSEEHTSELQSLMRISYAVFCLKKNTHSTITNHITNSKPTHTRHDSRKKT